MEKQKQNNEGQDAHVVSDSELTGMVEDIIGFNQRRAGIHGAIHMPEGTSSEVAGRCVEFIKQYNDSRRPDKYSNQRR